MSFLLISICSHGLVVGEFIILFWFNGFLLYFRHFLLHERAQSIQLFGLIQNAGLMIDHGEVLSE